MVVGYDLAAGCDNHSGASGLATLHAEDGVDVHKPGVHLGRDRVRDAFARAAALARLCGFAFGCAAFAERTPARSAFATFTAARCAVGPA